MDCVFRNIPIYKYWTIPLSEQMTSKKFDSSASFGLNLYPFTPIMGNVCVHSESTDCPYIVRLENQNIYVFVVHFFVYAPLPSTLRIKKKSGKNKTKRKKLYRKKEISSTLHKVAVKFHHTHRRLTEKWSVPDTHMDIS